MMNVYIHVPFCRRKCDYCAFYSEASAEDSPMAEAWLNKLERDISGLHLSEEVSTLYLGGGTPTFLSAAHLKRLYAFLRGAFRFAPGAEITTECNPGTLTPEKAEILCGFVNRVSMGVQSFDPDLLQRIGRGSGTPREVRNTTELLRASGLKNLGFDLICDLPGETPEKFRKDIDSALELEPDHLSVYSLILEKETPLGKRCSQNDLPDDAVSAETWIMTGELLKAAGMPRYEVSNYATPKYRCRHNWNVWHGEPYVGFGPSACSFDGIMRKTEASPLSAWLTGKPAERDPLPREARLREIFIMGMRTVDGWLIHGNYDWTFLLPELEKLQKQGYLKITNESVFPTQHGLLFWNSMAEALI